jgi:hypothetical protein
MQRGAGARDVPNSFSRAEAMTLAFPCLQREVVQ